MFRLAIFLRRGGFRIVHTHDVYANLLGIPAAVIARVPVIISSQRDLAHLDLYRTAAPSLASASAETFYRRADQRERGAGSRAGRAAVCSRKGSRHSQRRGHGEIQLRDRAIGTGSRPGSAKEKWIVLVGNMHSDVKGHPWLIVAAGAITREFPDVRFILVGDGALRKDFEGQVAALGLERHFLFLGRREDVPRVLACCDIAVLPSKAEGLPNAVLEYLAAGLPTVASRVGGNAEIVQDGKSGLLVPPEDSSALAEALLRLLRYPGVAASLGKNGRAHVARIQFSADD